MGIINPQIPSINSPTETEDPKIVDALTTIRDEINGGLDDSNVDAAADINGSKLLDASVSLDKISNLSTLILGTAQIKLYTGQASGTVSGGVACSIASVPPGIYLVLGQIEGGTNGGSSIDTTGGTADVYDQKTSFDAYSVTPSMRNLHQTLVSVTATTTIRLKSPSGTGRMTVIGIET